MSPLSSSILKQPAVTLLFWVQQHISYPFALFAFAPSVSLSCLDTHRRVTSRFKKKKKKKASLTPASYWEAIHNHLSFEGYKTGTKRRFREFSLIAYSEVKYIQN